MHRVRLGRTSRRVVEPGFTFRSTREYRHSTTDLSSKPIETSSAPPKSPDATRRSRRTVLNARRRRPGSCGSGFGSRSANREGLSATVLPIPSSWREKLAARAVGRPKPSGGRLEVLPRWASPRGTSIRAPTRGRRTRSPIPHSRAPLSSRRRSRSAAHAAATPRHIRGGRARSDDRRRG